MKTYDSYKDSGVQWIGEIPSHWEVSRIRSISSVHSGSTPKDNPDYWDGDIPWITPSDIGKVKHHRYIHQTSRSITSEGLNSCGCSIHPPHSIVLTNRGPIGNVIVPTMEYSTNQGCKSIIPIDYNHLYLYYHLYTSNDILNSMGQGTTFLELSTSSLKEFRVVNPPLPEQEQIVSYLDEKTSKIDDLIKKKEQKIELLKEYRTSLINRVITKGLNPDVPMKDSGVEWIGEIPSHWEVSKVKHSGSFINGFPFKPEDWSENGKPIIRIQTLTGTNTETNKYKGELHDKYLIRRGDLLFSWSTTLGMYLWDDEDGWLNQHIFKVVPKVTYNREYYRYMFSPLTLFLTSRSHGSTMTHLTKENFGGNDIPLPPLPEQEQIVSYLDGKTGEIDSTIDSEKKKIDLLKEYRQSLISSVITGKIKVVD